MAATCFPEESLGEFRDIPFYPNDPILLNRCSLMDTAPLDKVIILHYFKNDSIISCTPRSVRHEGTFQITSVVLDYHHPEPQTHWYVTNVDDNGKAYGWTCPEVPHPCSEWGPIHLAELEENVNIRRDDTWKPIKARDGRLEAFPYDQYQDDDQELSLFDLAPPGPRLIA